MNQISDILTLAQQAASQKVDAVLATVVHTEGSAYRRAGAMMLICDDGRSVGMISGGCLEPHIIKRAFFLTRHGANVQVYQTGDETGEDDKGQTDNSEMDDNGLNELTEEVAFNDTFEAELNFGLGCHGRVHVLFERLATAMPFLDLIRQVRDTQQSARVATLIRSDDGQLQVGMRFNVSNIHRLNPIPIKSIEALNDVDCADYAAYTQHLTILSEYDFSDKKSADTNTAFVPITTLAKSTLADASLAPSLAKLAKPKAPLQSQWLIQNLQPQKRLLICGAGNDVLPLVAMAKQQDWQVTVVDSRPQYAQPRRFSTADTVICLPLDAEDDLIALSRNAAVAVMSHSLTQDRARLHVLLQHPPLYLGQLGPRYRTERLLSDITSVSRNPDQLQAGIRQLQYPIGLKLGGEGPEALALGIMAQIAALLHGKQVAIIEQSNRSHSCDSHSNIEDTRVNNDNKHNKHNSKGKNSPMVLTTETVL